MKTMKMNKKIIALTAILIGMTGWAGDSVSFLLDTTDPLITAPITYNSSWVGDDSSAEIVISTDGMEIKRTTGEGEFAWAPTTAGKHTLTYTTFINGIAQEEVYTATVYADWKYTIEDGKATIVETTQKSGSVTIPSKIDGFPVVGLGDGLFNGCEGLTSVTISDSVYSLGANVLANCTGLTNVSVSFPLKGQIEAGNIFLGCSENLEVVYREAEIKNVIGKQRFPWNGKVDIEFEIEGNPLAGLTPDSHLALVVTAEDRKTGARYVASEAYLSGDMNVVSGVRKIVWDLASDGCKFKSGDIAISVACALSQAEVLYEGQNASIAVDTRSSLLLEKDDNISLIYNSSWVGGDSSAEVVISVDGTEIKRTTGEGEFMWSPTTAGKHTLTYTTYINGVAQDEVYETVVWVGDWRYELNEGRATITGTVHVSGDITIPSEIDGYPVVAVDENTFRGCAGLKSVTLPLGIFEGSIEQTPQVEKNNWIEGEDGVYQSNDINDSESTSMTLEVEGPMDFTFDWKVSSESNYDKLKWYVDGSQISESSGTGNGWQTVSYSIPEGSHTIRWEYSKDGSVSNGDDCGWVRFTESVSASMTMSNLFPDSYTAITNVFLTGEGERIPPYAFAGCTSLENVEIPESVTNIGTGAFNGCAALSDEDGFLIIRDVMYGYFGENAKVTIPNGVTDIAPEAFCGCDMLTEVIIPDSVKCIGDYAFAWCYSLTNMFFEGNAPKIGESAFLDVNSSCTIYVERGSAGWNVYIPGEMNGVNIEYVYKPIEWTIVDGVLIEANLNGATDVTIPSNVTNIGDRVFSNCTSLNSVTIPDSVTRIGNGAFENCQSLFDVTIPESVVTIGDSAFEYCSYLHDLTVSNGVKNIGNRAFYSCSSLIRVDIPNSVTNIGNLAFSSCNSIWSITIPESVKTIGDYAFSYCYWLESIALPASLMHIGSGVFSGCTSLTQITLNKDNMYLKLENDFLLSKDGTKLISYLGDKTVVTIPDGVKHIGTSAFSGCESLKSVTMPNTVVSIGNSVFEYCRSLSNIAIPDFVTSIGDYTFYFCEDLTGISIPNGVTNIGEYAFAWCSSLKSVTIPNSVARVGSWAFEACNNSLYNRTLIPNVLVVDGWAVGYEIPLSEELNLAGIRGISDSAFGCSSELTSIVIPESVSYIGSFSFVDCSSLTRVVFEGNAPKMGDSVFSGTMSACIAYIESDSTGWNVDVPGEWHGIKIKYSSLPIDFVLGGMWIDGVSGGGIVKGYEDGTSESGMSVKFTAEDSSSVWIETVVTNSGVVSFDWKVSSESFKSMKIDYASFWVDGNEVLWLGGEIAWTNTTYVIDGDGPHTLRWTYTKDSSGMEGDDCAWIGNVSFNPTVKVFFSSSSADAGMSPETITGICGNTVFLPGSSSLSKAKHTFQGWTDGIMIFSQGESYVLPETNIVMSAVWCPKVVTPPVIQVPDRYDTENTIVSISSSMNGVEIRYTIDGSEPTEESLLYVAPFKIVGTTTIRAVAFMNDWFPSSEAIATSIRVPWTIGECLNASKLTFEMSGLEWHRSLIDSHDGIASIQSGNIGDAEETSVCLKVSGSGYISFWWKVSSEAYKQYQVDYLSFSIDGKETEWIGGLTDWRKVETSIEGSGVHVIKWTYKKDSSGAEGEDCAWLDEVVWTPISDPIPELPATATAAEVAAALEGSTDAKLTANITDAATYAAYRTWALGLAGVTPDAVKASPNAWLSYALDTDALITAAPKEGDVVIDTFKSAATDGAFEFAVKIDGIAVGDNASAANVRKVFDIEGAEKLVSDGLGELGVGFSSDNVEVNAAAPENDNVKFTVTPKLGNGELGTGNGEKPESFFFRVKMK